MFFVNCVALLSQYIHHFSILHHPIHSLNIIQYTVQHIQPTQKPLSNFINITKYTSASVQIFQRTPQQGLMTHFVGCFSLCKIKWIEVAASWGYLPVDTGPGFIWNTNVMSNQLRTFCISLYGPPRPVQYTWLDGFTAVRTRQWLWVCTVCTQLQKRWCMKRHKRHPEKELSFETVYLTFG